MKRNTFLFTLLLLGLWITAHSPIIQAAPTTDAVVGDGGPGSCNEANFNYALNIVQISGSGTITFNCGGTATILFTSAKFIDANVTIDGGNLITLSGGNTTQLFVVNNALTVNNLAIKDGYLIASYGGAIMIANGGKFVMNNSSITDSMTDPGLAGGAIIDFGGYVTLNDSLIQGNSTSWGAINSTGALTLTNTIVQGNEALGGGGGGLSVGGTVLIQNSQIISNTTDGNGGGIYATPSATITIINSLIGWNSATGEGGGIYFDGSTAALTGTTIDTNSANIGGGISIFNASAQITLEDTTISNNGADYAGGGIDNDATLIGDRVLFVGNGSPRGGGIRNDEGTITLRNTTFSQNIGNDGGGLYNDAGQATLTFVTFAFNRSKGADSDSIYHSGLDASNTLILQNVVLAHTDLLAVSVNCWIADGSATSITSNGHNLADDDSCPFNQPTDTLNTDPLLGTLADNGGLTQTHLPLTNSPLINGGLCVAGITTDQRGVSRPQGTTCDIGAVESRPSDLLNQDIYLPIIIR